MSGGASLIRGDAIRIPLRDESVDLIVTSPPYFAPRSYRDGGEHYEGQIGSEETPQAFLEALWTVTAECWRVLKPTGSLFVNLGDKYAGSGGHNNAGISDKSTLQGNGHVGGVGKAGPQKIKATLRSAPDRYNQSTSFAATEAMRRGIGDKALREDEGLRRLTEKQAGVRSKSLMGLPWRYAIGAIERGWILREDLVWSKPNGLPESARDRVRRSHEYWFHLTKQGDYFSSIDEIREPQMRTGGEDDPAKGNRSGGGQKHRTFMPQHDMFNPLGKLPGSVWTIPSEPLIVPEHVDVNHFAAFPQEWPRRLILGWSPSGVCSACGEGQRPILESEKVKPPAHGPQSTTGKDHGEGPNDHRATGERFDRVHTVTGYACQCPTTDAPTRSAVVLDPFVGTGTVPMVARSLGRYGIGLDLSADYLRLARWRVFESGHAAKSIRRTNEERQGELLA